MAQAKIRKTKLPGVSKQLEDEVRGHYEAMRRLDRPNWQYARPEEQPDDGVKRTGWGARAKPATVWTAEITEKIIDLYNSGKSNTEIAEAIGMDVQKTTTKISNLRRSGTIKPRQKDPERGKQ